MYKMPASASATAINVKGNSSSGESMTNCRFSPNSGVNRSDFGSDIQKTL